MYSIRKDQNVATVLPHMLAAEMANLGSGLDEWVAKTTVTFMIKIYSPLLQNVQKMRGKSAITMMSR